MNKKEIIDRLLEDFEDKEEMSKEIYHNANPFKWTLPELMIRQFLNNGGDGFGMTNVEYNYGWLKSIKEDLIKHNLISSDGLNNAGYPLWLDYNF
jgi:hypothetical protein